MAFGHSNAPGATYPELLQMQQQMEDDLAALTASVVNGSLTAALRTRDGQTIRTRDGEVILANMNI